MIPENNNNIVILETNPVRRDNLRSILSQWGFTPISFDRETICLDNLPVLNPHLVISGSLPLERTFRFINTTQKRYHGLCILIISNDHKIQNFIKINGFDGTVVIKPSIDPRQIKRVISGVQNTRLKAKLFQKRPLIVGNSLEIVKIKKMISELTNSKDTILIQGDQGTGKELIARAIHHSSSRRNNPFVKVQVGDLSSEWFEYEENALKGVQKSKKGIFDLAHSGTIYLDRIEKAPAPFQTKMLQMLDEKSTSVAGSEMTNNVDVRIIAATRKNLNLLVNKKDFRKDLFYRLNVISIKIPPLKNRSEDIPLLADFFNDVFCGELGKCYGDISQKTKDILSLYHWPGNVRELKNVIKNMVLYADTDIITAKFIDNNQLRKSLNYSDDKQNFSAISDISHIKEYLRDLNKISLKDIQREFIAKTEKKMIKEALAETNWNRKKASILLDISYKSLLNKIKSYKLT